MKTWRHEKIETIHLKTAAKLFNKPGPALPINVDFIPLGDRVNIKGIDISEGQIILDMFIHGPNDPMCCPTLDTIMRFVLVDEDITPL